MTGSPDDAHSKADTAVLSAIFDLVCDALNEHSQRPVVIGLCGAQGAGKSTLVDALVDRCDADGIPAAVLSLDDLYLTRADRLTLAKDIHPLLATRGVPGTHEVDLGISAIDALLTGEGPLLPRFDKSSDDRCPLAEWPRSPEGCRVLIFEGWCVGARAQEPSGLAPPVNELERTEDPQAIWRRYANDALMGEYSRLWARLDRLALLAAPSFDIVRDWRLEQEHDLAARRGSGKGLMDDKAVGRFVSHYERLTRHILAEMPARADLVIRLDTQRRPVSIRRRRPSTA